MNPQIQSRWGILCPSCQKKLINPNQPWPVPCTTCGTRTHVKCLQAQRQWLVDLDTDLDPNLIVSVCQKCLLHAENNLRLIQNLPQASGTQPFDAYRAYKARRPALPKRNVINLWGEYRVDPVNFVPAVSKVLDIVHSSGPKVRWAVKLGAHSQVPMTNLSSKEITLPNYFDSPNALGRTHEEILDAMTGAAMHEAGHAAYDKAETIIKAQKVIRPGPGQSSTAAAICLNIVADYNLERRVIERYPAFRHYFSECHRWSVQDTLPQIVTATQEDGAEDRLNVRLAIVTWEMLGPGDIAAAGGLITPKLQWIVNKCFDILKYSYDRGHLHREDGKLKTARAIYELIRVVNPIGAPSSMPMPVLPPPQGTQPQGTNQQAQPDDQGQGQGQGQGTQPPDDATCGFPGVPSEESPDLGDDTSESEDTDDDSDVPEGGPDSPEVQDPDESTDARATSGEPDRDSEGPEGSLEASQGEEQAASSSEGSGSGDPDDDGQRTDSGEDGGSDDGDGNASGSSDSSEGSEGQTGSQGGTQDSDDQPHDPDNTGPEGDDAGDPGLSEPTSGSRGGKTGSEAPPDESVDPFTGKSTLQDDPSRRKNAKKDALDDLEEQNAAQPKVDETPYDAQYTYDQNMDQRIREKAEQLANPPTLAQPKVPDYELPGLEVIHTARIHELAPTISKLKKVLRFRNIDWGGRQTGRRSGTLTRRHVSRLSTLGAEKVFHKTRPDATPKVRIALLIDESESMRNDGNNTIEPYIAARNAATALTQALKGIRGVKLWSWGFSFKAHHVPGHVQHIPQLRQYVDPYHAVNPASIETWPMFGGTPTGEAMDFAAHTITHNASADEKCIVFIITDGEAGGYVSTFTAVRKWTDKVTFVHIGIGPTQDPSIPYYVGPVLDTALLPEMLDEAVSEILR